MSKNIFRIGSRKSALAMWQTEYIISELKKVAPENEYIIIPMETKGDKILDVSLSKIGEKGLFTEALESAMLSNKIDMAVHSLKDMPTKLPAGLTLSGFSKRYDPRDAWISKNKHTIESLPKGAVVGTSSLRRISQLKKIRPDLNIKDLRGNIDTRLKKFYNGDYSAIILAAAGLERLNLHSVITERLDMEKFIPAVGQGIITVEARIDDEKTISLLRKIENLSSKYAALSERAFLRTLEGGCQAPIGAHAVIDDNQIKLYGFISDINANNFIQMTAVGEIDNSEQLGIELANKIVSVGAKKFKN